MKIDFRYPHTSFKWQHKCLKFSSAVLAACSLSVWVEMVNSRHVSMLHYLCVENISRCHPSPIWAKSSTASLVGMGYCVFLHAYFAIHCRLMRQVGFVC